MWSKQSGRLTHATAVLSVASEIPEHKTHNMLQFDLPRQAPLKLLHDLGESARWVKTTMLRFQRGWHSSHRAYYATLAFVANNTILTHIHSHHQPPNVVQASSTPGVFLVRSRWRRSGLSFTAWFPGVSTRTCWSLLSFPSPLLLAQSCSQNFSLRIV